MPGENLNLALTQALFRFAGVQPRAVGSKIPFKTACEGHPTLPGPPSDRAGFPEEGGRGPAAGGWTGTPGCPGSSSGFQKDSGSLERPSQMDGMTTPKPNLTNHTTPPGGRDGASTGWEPTACLGWTRGPGQRELAEPRSHVLRVPRGPTSGEKACPVQGSPPLGRTWGPLLCEHHLGTALTAEVQAETAPHSTNGGSGVGQTRRELQLRCCAALGRVLTLSEPQSPPPHQGLRTTKLQCCRGHWWLCWLQLPSSGAPP